MLGFLLVVLLIYGFVYFKEITGNVSLDLELESKEGQSPQGIIRLSLKEGELIPASSIIVFENDGQRYEYTLSELVSDELIEGDFYVEGSGISGRGEGYGLLGEKETPIEVSFLLEILTIKDSKKSGGESSNNSGRGSIGNSGESTTEEVSAVSEETIEGGATEISKDNIEETIGETNIEESTTEEGTITETKKEDKKDKKPKENKEEVIEEINTKESQPKTQSFTGNIIRGLFGFATNFFLGITGQISLEVANEIEGSVFQTVNLFII